MKRISILIALIGMVGTTSLQAQTESETKKDSTESVTTPESTEEAETVVDSTKQDDVEVVITTKKDQDSTIVRVKGMKIIVLNDEESGQAKQIIVDTEDCEDCDDKVVDWKKQDPVSHWAGLRMGINGYLYNDGLPLAAGDQSMVLDYGRSISWDVNLFEKDFRLYKNYVELVTGLGMHFGTYSFESQYTTLLNTPENEPLEFVVDSTRLLSKNRLKTAYITAPLMLGFATNQDEDKAFRLAFGGQASWRVASRLKQQNAVGGEKLKVKGDYDLNPFLFHAVASVGYGPVNIYANYGLNPLFKSGKTTGDLHPFDLGLQLMF